MSHNIDLHTSLLFILATNLLFWCFKMSSRARKILGLVVENVPTDTSSSRTVNDLHETETNTVMAQNEVTYYIPSSNLLKLLTHLLILFSCFLVTIVTK